MKVLLVDDDQQLASFVRLGLEDQQIQVTVAYDGDMAERIATGGRFDVIVLDVMLPGINGFELCKKIRHHRVETPILMLTSLDSTDDKVTGLETGADDYLSKPFEFPELLNFPSFLQGSGRFTGGTKRKSPTLSSGLRIWR